MAKAICPDCGDPRPGPTDYCRSCGWNPYAGEGQMAKSLYLSSARFDGEPPDRLSEYERELDRLGRTIDEGATIEFDPSELARLQERAEREFPLPPVPVFAFFVGTFICVAILGLAVWYFYWLQHRAI